MATSEKKTAYERFEAKVRKEATGCWIWTGAKDGSGYGKFKGHDKVMTPHKFSYEDKTKSTVPKGKIVKHTCDEPLCVNPEHLVLGTYSENAKERWTRTGRNLQPADVITRAIRKAIPAVTENQLINALQALGLSVFTEPGDGDTA